MEAFDGNIFDIHQLKIGDKYKKLDKELHHIVNLFEDPDTNEMIITTKWYSKYKQAWYYNTMPLWLELYNICLLYNLTKPERKKFYKLNGLTYEH